MTKAKLKDATKDLLKGAETVMESVASVRKGADELVQALRKFESQYSREEEQRRAEEKQAEQQRLVQQHTKAYTMPDTDEEIIEAKPVAEPKKATSEPVVLAKKESTKPSQEPVIGETHAQAAPAVKSAEAASTVKTAAVVQPMETPVEAKTASAANRESQAMAAVSDQASEMANVAPSVKDGATKTTATQPATRPTKSAAQPEAPVAKSATQPATATVAMQPAEGLAQPAMATAQSATPAAQPATDGGQLPQGGARPFQPAYAPTGRTARPLWSPRKRTCSEPARTLWASGESAGSVWPSC